MEIGLALGIGSLIATAIIGGGSFYLTYKTSTAATRDALAHSAEMKITEMRQQWIDDLREHAAKFVAKSSQVIAAARRGALATGDNPQYEYNYITLKLNMNEEKHKSLHRAMNGMGEVTNEFLQKKSWSKAEVDRLIKKYDVQQETFLETARAIFREEWERVRSIVRSVPESKSSKRSK